MSLLKAFAVFVIEILLGVLILIFMAVVGIAMQSFSPLLALVFGILGFVISTSIPHLFGFKGAIDAYLGFLIYITSSILFLIHIF